MKYVLIIFQFDWYCTTLDGGSCPAFEISEKKEVKGRGKEVDSTLPTLTTLEAVIDKKNLRKAELIIDGDLLPPGEYIFTLAAAKGQFPFNIEVLVFSFKFEKDNLDRVDEVFSAVE